MKFKRRSFNACLSQEMVLPDFQDFGAIFGLPWKIHGGQLDCFQGRQIFGSGNARIGHPQLELGILFHGLFADGPVQKFLGRGFMPGALLQCVGFELKSGTFLGHHQCNRKAFLFQ